MTKTTKANGKTTFRVRLSGPDLKMDMEGECGGAMACALRILLTGTKDPGLEAARIAYLNAALAYDEVNRG